LEAFDYSAIGTCPAKQISFASIKGWQTTALCKICAGIAKNLSDKIPQAPLQ
jgi:hypothetical protein